MHALDFPTAPKLAPDAPSQADPAGRAGAHGARALRRADGLGRGGGGAEARARPHGPAGGGRLPGLLPRDDRGRAVGHERHGVRGPGGHPGALHALPLLLPLPAGPAPAVVRGGVREAPGELPGGPLQRRAKARGGDRGGGAGGGRHGRPAGGVAGGGARDHPPPRGAADRGRDPDRVRQDGSGVCVRTRRGHPRRDGAVQGDRGHRVPAVGDRVRRVAGHVGAGGAHRDLPRAPGRDGGGRGGDRGDARSSTSRATHASWASSRWDCCARRRRRRS